ncbi:DUF447 family protein [Cupriavidus basilensis]|uniref:DUF447 family protein n=1 Tax=Cupriavidus basilensis TaxID=68895 RepID=A0ABT6B0S7_9BURK|nr:DUF447 domain-containing protein [Cupriavidus basilensis]MDF3838213.1 DUF447 family protein [Cupriavidus basilensis]
MSNDVIYETIVTTVSAAGAPHIAPMGVRYAGGDIVLMPFRPSATYDNIVGTGTAVVNLTTDVRVFAGCVTGRRQWPTVPAQRIHGVRLAGALSHVELRLAQQSGDPARPSLRMARVIEASHGDFPGFNRAQAAVIEGAVLVSRLHLLPADKIAREMAYLQIAIDKTAGAAEREAWQWLQQRVAAWHAGDTGPAHGARHGANPEPTLEKTR